MPHARAHSILPAYVPRSTSYDGRFGRMFGKLPAWVPPGDDEEQRKAAIRDFATNQMFLPAGQEPELHPSLPVGYTYFGQFIDHDITFDPTSSLQRQNDPEGLSNFRSPRLDLDSIYGRGPDDQPYLYEQNRSDGAKGVLRTGTGANGKEPDLARFVPPGADGSVEAIALIGDPRNDENIIVSQLQLAVIRLHNEVLRRVRHLDEKRQAAAVQQGRRFTIDPMAQFHEAQRITRWFYQYLVWNDFVRQIVPEEIWTRALVDSSSGEGLALGLKDIYNWKLHPFIPVEFSVAAYRFGHSMIRTGYQLNLPRQVAIDPANPVGPQFELPVFDPTASGKPDLHGGRLLLDSHTIEWDWFFSMGAPPSLFPQRAHAIDARLSRSVFDIPGGSQHPNPLAALNILRGWRFDLPSGTSVARALGLEPITLEHPMENALWVYVLKEAQTTQQGKRLGPVGGSIVAAVFAGLLKGDPLSYVEQFPHWTPADEPVLAFGPRRPAPSTGEANDPAKWDIRDLLVIAGMPIHPDQVEQVIKNGPLPPVDLTGLEP